MEEEQLAIQNAEMREATRNNIMTQNHLKQMKQMEEANRLKKEKAMNERVIKQARD